MRPGNFEIIRDSAERNLGVRRLAAAFQETQNGTNAPSPATAPESLMGPGWSRMLGIWCNTNHPALAGFPTEANCDWQWTEIIKMRAINLSGLPSGLPPIVSAIDDWNRNWKL